MFEEIEGDRVTHDQNRNLTNIYNDIFGMNKKVTGCASCVKQTVKDLKAVYEAYKD